MAGVDAVLEPTWVAVTPKMFKRGRDENEPWGRVNPRYVIDETGLEKHTVEYFLRRLHDAGWIRTASRGRYEFVEDPRETDTT
ncbi:ArsR family transcriptional regulator [Natronococcus amylolyticus]|uniref:ArsR family transcriptional regulator n=1 Tax=Natronococcus amylolyticus TaxID=44470 RepID=UPI001F4CEDC5|nr:ArsR family transcriptional regulator [Natronococcus amylolyticus]